MFPSPHLLLVESIWCSFAVGQYLGLSDDLNFDFTPSDSPQPFTIDVDPDFIAVTRLKAQLYRASKPITQPAWADGPPTVDISTAQQYFVNNYSWFDTQAYLNEKYSQAQFTTTVSAGPNYTEPVYLHFAHKFSNRSDAVPLLMLHGWPSSFLEFEDVIDSLVSPPNSSLPAFHVITPNIPGFGFSPAPTADGFGSREAGIAFNNLMLQLGYDKYTFYSTDLGSSVARWMLYDAAENIVSRWTSFYFVSPNANDLARYAANETTPEENTFFTQLNYFTANDEGYIAIQTTKPLSLAYALTDSPLGFLAWTWEYRYHAGGAYDFSVDDLITQMMLLYIQGTYGNLHAYKTWWAEGALNDTLYPSSDIPVGLTHWQSGALGRDDAIQYAVSNTFRICLLSVAY